MIQETSEKYNYQFPMCNFFGGTSTVARVFDQDLTIKNLNISCIEFSYLGMGSIDFTLELYIDTTGGNPDLDSMIFLDSVPVSSINSLASYQTQTVSFPAPVTINFPDKIATLVVVMSIPNYEVGALLPAGMRNSAVSGTYLNTFFGGDCASFFSEDDSGFVSYSEVNFSPTSKKYQWDVKLVGTSSSVKKNDDNDDVCFSADSSVSMADGSTRLVSELRVGDSVMVAAENGARVAAEVVFLPHS